ncbi:hypothetical protein [Aquibacillus albus]|uniref:Uncharacterized protein n=1 Tax=Aquibacillus albus TaxID=1168171 RepID=A0ABS2N6C4_9BACI|nr:hypothetical protein [Aquibacillus albus]MBM7573685.1 hypothetical protein [Aquibacillus albus]
MHRVTDVRRKIADWQEMNASYLKEMKKLITEIKGPKDFQVISYFTYSLNIFHEQERENFCLGSYHIQNLGGKPLTNPYICIKVSSDSPFDFSGKYIYKESKQKVRLTNAWERINDPMDKQEFWLKPNDKLTLEPSETLSFSNFQVKWRPNSSYTGSILGFTYGDEINEGINALNQISINGTINKEDEEDEL